MKNWLTEEIEAGGSVMDQYKLLANECYELEEVVTDNPSGPSYALTLRPEMEELGWLNQFGYGNFFELKDKHIWKTLPVSQTSFSRQEAQQYPEIADYFKAKFQAGIGATISFNGRGSFDVDPRDYADPEEFWEAICGAMEKETAEICLTQIDLGATPHM